MIKRIVEISKPSSLSIRNQQLIIKQADGEHSVPLEDLGLLILDNPQITHTQHVLVACSQHNIAVIICGVNHLPASLLLSLVGSTLQTKFLAQQIQAQIPAKKRLWQLIIKAKIKAQFLVLSSLKEKNKRLESLINEVKSGDTQNAEAQASRIYWKKLFGDTFHRDRDSSGPNALLNYGYAILRASIARAVVGAGLHPSIGIHHKNQFNSFCLVDDLIEPLRPLIDMRVYELTNQEEEITAINQSHKKALLECLSWQINMGTTRYPLLVALHEYVASVRQTLAGEIKQPQIPTL